MVLLERAGWSPRAPSSSPPWPASITTVRRRTRGARSISGGASGGATDGAGRLLLRWRLGGLRRPHRPRSTAPRSPGMSDVLNDANRGPRSITSGRGTFAGADCLDELGRPADGGQDGVEHVGFEPDEQTRPVLGRRYEASPAALRASGGRRVRAARCVRRCAARGCRRSSSSREVCAARAREPSAGASARDTKSTGTNHVRPSRTGGAGSEMQPSADGCEALAGRQYDGLIAHGDGQPPAAASSRTVSSKSGARSSSANISCPAASRVASGRRPSRVSTVYGGAAAGACAAGTPPRTASSRHAAAMQNRRDLKVSP